MKILINDIIRNRYRYRYIVADAEAGRNFDKAEFVTIDWVKSKLQTIKSCIYSLRGFE